MLGGDALFLQPCLPHDSSSGFQQEEASSVRSGSLTYHITLTLTDQWERAKGPETGHLDLILPMFGCLGQPGMCAT